MSTEVKKIMTEKIITIRSGATVLDAGNLMADKRIRHLPVMDDDGLIVGLVSQRDLSLVSDPRNVSVDWIMSSPAHSINQDVPLRKAIFKMLELKISCLLVTDGDDNVLGIATTDDLLWYLAQLLNDEKESHFALLKAKNLQTIGEVTNQIAEMGI